MPYWLTGTMEVNINNVHAACKREGHSIRLTKKMIGTCMPWETGYGGASK